MDLAEGADGLADHVVDVAARGYVRAQRQRLAVLARDLSRDRVSAIAVDIGADHVGAFAREDERRGFADAARGTCYDDGLLAEIVRGLGHALLLELFWVCRPGQA